MKALNLHAIGDLRYEDVSDPIPEKDEVLLKVLAAGICGSDVPRVFTKGTYHFPTIPGHEFAGEIVATGDTDDPAYADLIGKRAAVFPLLPCFDCDACAQENYASCANYDYYGSRRDGAFADYIAVKKWNLVMAPEGVPTEWAAMTEPCAVAIHALGKADLKSGDTIAIFGAGAIGLIIALLARAKGAKHVILLDVDGEKLGFANKLGFSHAISNKTDDYLEEIHRLTGGRGADISLDAAGVPATVAGCLKAAAPFGTVVLMGNPSGDITLAQRDYWEILRKQLTLRGTWNSDYGAKKNDWQQALAYMADGTLDLTGFVTQRFALADGEKAFALARDRNEFYVKILFTNKE
ncbi:MAG: galactitol-1-phosphate 5-dehydrogenase [Clostridiales Family XIII bacterium]|jgi:L-iditol 2-dehydrogenase|nr:galactitol-1-phosphate 5-dehydrogenase [Clostridiales Family XIII bacterium]